VHPVPVGWTSIVGFLKSNILPLIELKLLMDSLFQLVKFYKHHSGKTIGTTSSGLWKTHCAETQAPDEESGEEADDITDATFAVPRYDVFVYHLFYCLLKHIHMK